MKRNSRWAGIIGGLLAVIFLVSEAITLSHPADSLRANIAANVGNLLLVGLGVFLVSIYLKNKHAEDAGHGPVALEPNSAEDIESLKRRRNRIFGFVLLIEAIQSVSSWIINDYSAGFTPQNVGMIFDVLMNIVFLWMVVKLFKNKNILGILLPTVIFYAIGWIAVDLWRAHWLGIIYEILFAGYFVYASKAPLNRKNHRIAHTIILPAVIILSFVIGIFDNGRLDQLLKNEAKLEQEYTNANIDLTSRYSVFAQKEIPNSVNSVDIKDVRDAIKVVDTKIKNVVLAINALQEEYKKQIASQQQKDTLKRLQNILTIFDLTKKQLEKLDEFMLYAEQLNFRNLSEKQKLDIDNFKREIENLNSQIREVSLKLNN